MKYIKVLLTCLNGMHHIFNRAQRINLAHAMKNVIPRYKGLYIHVIENEVDLVCQSEPEPNMSICLVGTRRPHRRRKKLYFFTSIITQS